MNREILFRGKSYTDDKWHYGLYSYQRGTPFAAERHEIFDGALGWNCPPETIGQYTGLKDKNGVKIFEGDIVTFEDAVADYEGYHDDVFLNRGEVTYTERGMCLYFTNRQVVEMGDLFYKETADCEVIGNIHDNPELAGEENKP
jgi:uncharacterized phage protein (TIGR01671 family)